MAEQTPETKPAVTPAPCECGRTHQPGDNCLCPKCGACHFAHGKHVPDDYFPLSICTKCGEGHLWD